MKAKPKRGAQKVFANAKVIDAKRPLAIEVTVQDIRCGVPTSNDRCAGALRIMKSGYHKARVFRKCVYAQKQPGAPVERWMSNEAMRMIEAMNDTKAIPERAQSFKIVLRPATEKQSLAHLMKVRAKHRRAKKAGTAKKRGSYIRTGAAPLDVLGVRAPAKRNAVW